MLTLVKTSTSPLLDRPKSNLTYRAARRDFCPQVAIDLFKPLYEFVDDKQHVTRLKLDTRNFFSSRLVIQGELSTLRTANSFLSLIKRFINWVSLGHLYSDENRRTIACVKKYLTDQLGTERINRIFERYDMVSLDEMERRGSPLLSRDLAKIMVGVADVKIDDIEEIIQLAKTGPWPAHLSDKLREAIKSSPSSEQLDSHLFAQVYKELGSLAKIAAVPAITEEISGGEPTEFLAKYFKDSFLEDRERAILSEENPTDSTETFVHNFVVKIIGRELNVGMIIPAPNHQVDKTAQYYRVSAKIISGEGMVSYVLTPATSDTDLDQTRFFRGTSMRHSSIDAMSTVITDCQTQLGQDAVESGEIYSVILREELGVIPVVSGHSLGSTTAQKLIVNDLDIEKAFLYNGPGMTEKEVVQFNQRMSVPGAKEIELNIRDAHLDEALTVGQHHIGFKAPKDKVKVDYRKYYPRQGIPKGFLGLIQRFFFWISCGTLFAGSNPQITFSENKIDSINHLSNEIEREFRHEQPESPYWPRLLGGGYAHVLIPDRENRIHGMTWLNNEYHQELIDKELNRKGLPYSKEPLRLRLRKVLEPIFRLRRSISRYVFGSRAQDLRGAEIGSFKQGKWVVKHYS